jgi:hypothetical protein
MWDRASVLFAPLYFSCIICPRPHIAFEEGRGTRRIDEKGDYRRVLHEQLPTLRACMCVYLCVGNGGCEGVTDIMANNLWPPPLPTCGGCPRATDGCVMQASKTHRHRHSNSGLLGRAGGVWPPFWWRWWCRPRRLTGVGAGSPQRGRPTMFRWIQAFTE